MFRGENCSNRICQIMILIILRKYLHCMMFEVFKACQVSTRVCTVRVTNKSSNHGQLQKQNLHRLKVELSVSTANLNFCQFTSKDFSTKERESNFIVSLEVELSTADSFVTVKRFKHLLSIFSRTFSNNLKFIADSSTLNLHFSALHSTDLIPE